MDENPYKSPESDGSPEERVGREIPDFSREQYKLIAKAIGFLLLCLLLIGALFDS